MLLRFYSILFALIFGLFLAGVSLVILLSGAGNFRFDMLPYWKGDTAVYGLLCLGGLGVLAAVLAFLRKAKPLLVLFTLALLGVMVYGFFISPLYRFPGAAEAKNLAYVSVAALAAFIGSLFQFQRPDRA